MFEGKQKQEVLVWKSTVRDDPSCMEKFLAGCPKKELLSIFTHLFTLKYESIPDYDYCYYCIMHALKVCYF